MAQNGSKALVAWKVHIHGILEADTSPYFKSWHVSFLLHSFPLLSPSWGNLTFWINEYLSIKLWFYIFSCKKKNSTGPSCVCFGCFLSVLYSNNLRVVRSSFPGHLMTHQGIEGFGGRWFLLHHRLLGECRSPPRRLAGRLLPHGLV